MLEQGDEVFVDLAAQDHLYDVHGFAVGVAQTVDKAGFLADLFEHFRDLGAAAVNDNHAHADE